MKERMISVVVPAYNEEENLSLLYERLHKALTGYGMVFEVIFVNDGSTDHSQALLQGIHEKAPNVVVINFFRRMGKAIALEQGFKWVRGRYIVVIDSDLQHLPEDIPKLIQKMEEGYDVVSGKRVNRHDEKGKLLSSRIFNLLVRAITGLKFDDYFSGLKCFRADVIQYLSLYGDLYRFAAVFAEKEGFRVVEVPVEHQNRAHGLSKYNSFSRCQRAVTDLVVLFFSLVFSRERVYYLAMIGRFGGIAGFFLLGVLWFINDFKPYVLRTAWGMGSILLIFLWIEIDIFKKIADAFFARHTEEHARRARNIKNVLRRPD